MKKIFLAVVLTMVFVSGALAFGGEPGPGRGPRFEGKPMTPEMKANFEKMGTLHKQLRAELAKPTVDKAKAREIHQEIKKLRNDISDTRFEEMLKDPAKFSKKPGMRKEGPKLSTETKAKFDELRKLSGEVRAEFKKPTVDKAKIRSLCSKIQGIKNKLDNDRLEEMLKNPEKYKDCPFFGGPSGELRHGGPRGKNIRK